MPDSIYFAIIKQLPNRLMSEEDYSVRLSFMSKSRIRFIASACVLAYLAAASPAPAYDNPTISIRYLTILSNLIVVAEPVESKPGVLPTKYKVLDLIHGTDVKAGQTISVEVREIELSRPRWSNDEKPATELQIEKALLFLTVSHDDPLEPKFKMLSSGIRAVAKTGQILVPQQLSNPGPQYLLPVKDYPWKGVIAQIREDLPKIAQIRALGAIADRAERNRAIFKWIGEHKDEFGGGFFYQDEKPKGWASAEQKLFDWIMESCIPEDCWRAIVLAKELGTGHGGIFPSFCSPAGRELLLTKTFDEKLPAKLRFAALYELSAGHNFWCNWDDYPQAVVMSAAEQARVIDRLTPLTKMADPTWRKEAVGCIRYASGPNDAARPNLTTKHAIPTFIELYGSERNEEVRWKVVESIRQLEDQAFWQKLSGNPHGIAVRLGTRIDRGELEASLLLYGYSDAKIVDVPRLKLERLDAARKPVETKDVLPKLKYPQNSIAGNGEGWDGMATLTTSVSELPAGTWRVIVEGIVGPNSEPWHSEPSEFVVNQKDAAP